MKLVTIAIICERNIPYENVQDAVGKAIGLTLEDPSRTTFPKKDNAVYYWADLEFSDSFKLRTIQRQFDELHKEYLMIVMTKNKPKLPFYQKWGWLLGIISTIVVGVVGVTIYFLGQN